MPRPWEITRVFWEIRGSEEQVALPWSGLLSMRRNPMSITSDKGTKDRVSTQTPVSRWRETEEGDYHVHETGFFLNYLRNTSAEVLA